MKKLILIICLALMSSATFCQTKVMKITRKNGQSESVVLSEIRKITFESVDSIVTDIDGNGYKTITIGNQIWMAENLKVTRYNDGTPIFPMTGASQIFDLYDSSTGGFCAYNFDSSNVQEYGYLYNWRSVNTGKLAPVGWHIPTKSDWETLINYLGGESVAGGKLKETGTDHWNGQNIDASNIVWFSALAGGLISASGVVNLRTSGLWWSSTESEELGAYSLSLYYDSGSVYISSESKPSCFSIRCIKN